MRMLCVDDDSDTCHLLTTMLGFSDLEAEAVAVPNAAEALRVMASERFSLYVIDGQMPEVDGLTFCEEIRKVDKTTPIVFFTSHVGYASDIKAGMLAGAYAYIVKPYVNENISTVRRLLEQVSTAKS